MAGRKIGCGKMEMMGEEDNEGSLLEVHLLHTRGRGETLCPP